MAQYQKNVYCEIDFLHFLSEEINKTFSFDKRCFVELLSAIEQLLLCKYVKLHLNISEVQYYELIDSINTKQRHTLSFFENILSRIDDQRNTINQKIERDGENFPDLADGLNNQEIFLDGIYLTCKSKEICTQAMNDYGIIAICPQNMNDYIPILQDQGFAIVKRKGYQYQWEKILENNLCGCNSMVIIDNYLISAIDKTTKDIKSKDNLLSILKTLIPKKSKHPFHIAIFTELPPNGFDKGQKIDSVTERFKQIEAMLNDIRPDISFTLIKCNGEFHDRVIITNNLWISCGVGFELFDKKRESKEYTTINIIYPYLNKNIKWTSEAYANMIDAISKVSKNTPDYGGKINDTYSLFSLGAKEHRLLNYDKLSK